MKSPDDAMRRRSGKKGTPAGSLIHIGSKFAPGGPFICHRYNARSMEVIHDRLVTGPNPNGEAVTSWIEITGLSDLENLKPVFKELHVNRLILEDILNTDQNAKNDIAKDWIFFVIKDIQWNSADLSWSSDQISLVLQSDVIFSFTEKKSALFNPVYLRLDASDSRIRSRGAGFTFYSLLDLVVDEYLEICEKLEQKIEELELGMEGQAESDPTQTLHQIRKFQIHFRHQVLPLRDGIIQLIRDPDQLIDSEDLPYFQDILDHINQVISQLDQIRDNLASIRELYLTQLNIGMNKVIQYLTVISTIFIPITFIAGIYGMNFKYMPELQSQNGYFITLGAMVLIGLGSYLYFRRKRWM